METPAELERSGIIQMRFDHIGLFVANIEDGQRELSAMLPIREWTEIVDDDLLHVRVCFGTDTSGIRYELVAPLGDPNPVSSVLESGKNILNHVAYYVDDIDAAVTAMRKQGCYPLSRAKPAVAFNGARVVFMLTKLRFIVELIEAPYGSKQ